MALHSATRRWPVALLLAAFLIGDTAFAQSTDASVDATTPEPVGPKAVGPLLTGRLRYGVTHRRGDVADLGRGLYYTGITPNDFALSGSYFGKGYFGGALWLQREGFSLNDPAAALRVTSGALIRGAIGPSGRISFGNFLGELVVGYGFQQLPLVTSTNAPSLSGPASRHSLMLASRLQYELPAGFHVEARGELPIALATMVPGGRGTSSGFGVGGGVGYEIMEIDRTRLTAIADYQFVHDYVSSTVTTEASTQTLSRFGLSLQVTLVDRSRPPKPKFGGLLVKVFDEATGSEIPGVYVQIEVDGKPKALTEAQGGQFTTSGLAPGQYVARAGAAGYLQGEVTASVIAGRNESAQLTLKKEPPKVGGLTVSVLDKTTGSALVGATVKVRGEEYLTNPTGQVTLVELPPGPIEIEVIAKEFRPAKEVASVVVGRVAEVPVALNRAVKPVPATITGIVRSTRGGKPVAAELEIPEAKVKTRAAGAGSFSIRLPGGTYRVIISADGYITQNKSVTVRDGDQAIFNVDLYPTR
ncbi:MAG: MSCRAMM family protein [Myxococcaceae bacterium]